MDSGITAIVAKIFLESEKLRSLIIVLVVGWIIQLYNLPVLRTHIIEVYLTCVHMMLQLVNQITVSISQATL